MSDEDRSDRFEERYRITGGDVFLEIEREVLDLDYQATGYTTRAEADDLCGRLELDPGSRLLDLGSGCGFPGLYLADRTGCAVVTVDPVASGAEASRARARRDGLDGRHLAVTARGEALPLRHGSFDAIVHVDVTCWIGPKLSVLRACRSVLRPGGIMAFTAIVQRAGLTSVERRRAVDVGPTDVLVPAGYPSLLNEAGFVDVLAIDVTAAYRTTLDGWFQATQRRIDEARAIAGDEEIAERQARRAAARDAVDDGILERWMYVARRPVRRSDD